MTEAKRIQKKLDDGSANVSEDQVYKNWKDLQGCSLMEGEGIDGRAITSGQGETMQAMMALGLSSGAGVAPRKQSIQHGNQQPIVQTSPSSSKPSSSTVPKDFGDAFVPVFDLGNDNGTSEIGAGASGQHAPPSRTMTQAVRRMQPTGSCSTAEPKAAAKRVGRPPRDLAVLVRQTIDSFQAYASDEKDSDYRLFFGDACERQKAYLAQLQKDFQEWLKS